MKTGLKATEELADLPVLDGTDFDYPEHAPQWIPAGSARICGVCGRLDMPAEPSVVLRGGPRLDDEIEQLYRQEKWS